MCNRSNNAYINFNETRAKRVMYASFVLLGISLVIRMSELSVYISKLLKLNNYVTALVFDFFPSLALLLIVYCIFPVQKTKIFTRMGTLQLFYIVLYLCIFISFVITGIFVSIGRLYFILLFSITMLPLIILSRGSGMIQQIYDAFSDGFIDVGYAVWFSSVILQPFLISGYKGIFTNRNSYGEFNALLFGLYLYKIVVDINTYPAYQLTKVRKIKLLGGLAISFSMVLFCFSRTALLMIIVQIFMLSIFLLRYRTYYTKGLKRRLITLITLMVIVPFVLMGQLNYVAYPLYKNGTIIHDKYKSLQTFLNNEAQKESIIEGMPKEDILINKRISKVTPHILLTGHLGRLSIDEEISSYESIEAEEFKNEKKIPHENDKKSNEVKESIINEPLSSALYKFLTNSKITTITTKRSLIWHAYIQELGLLGHRKNYLFIPRYVREYSGTAHNVILQVAYDGGIFAGIAMSLLIGTSFIFAVKRAFVDTNNENPKINFFVVTVIVLFMISSLTGSEYSPFSSGIALSFYLALINII